MAMMARLMGTLPRGWIKAVARLQWKHPLLKRAFDLAAGMLRGGDGVIPQGEGKGLRFNPGGSNAGYVLGTSEPGLQRALSRFVKPGMTVLDLGASVGFHATIAARLVGPSGRVVCFEPLSENAKMVRHNAALNGFSHVEVEEAAVGARDGEARFLLSDTPNWGKVAQDGEARSATGERVVPQRSVDSVVAQRGLPPPGLIKIDVEGAEVDALAGAVKTLKSARPVLLIELHGTNARVASALTELDYETRVLGGGDSTLEQAHWNAHVLAFPKERTDLRAQLADVGNAAFVA